MIDAFEDSMPLLVGGTTGSGKTTLLRYLQNEFDGVSILFNSDEEPDMGTVVRDVKGLKAAIRGGHTEIDMRIPVMKSRDRELYEETVRFLMGLGQQFRGRDDLPLMQFITDEVQEYSPSGSRDDPAITAAKRMRKRGIKPVGATQEFQASSSRYRSVQEWTVWLSPPTSKMYQFIRQNTEMDLENLKALAQHEALVHDRAMNPVARVVAPEVYARE